MCNHKGQEWIMHRLQNQVSGAHIVQGQVIVMYAAHGSGVGNAQIAVLGVHNV